MSNYHYYSHKVVLHNTFIDKNPNANRLNGELECWVAQLSQDRQHRRGSGGVGEALHLYAMRPLTVSENYHDKKRAGTLKCMIFKKKKKKKEHKNDHRAMLKSNV